HEHRREQPDLIVVDTEARLELGIHREQRVARGVRHQVRQREDDQDGRAGAAFHGPPASLTTTSYAPSTVELSLPLTRITACAPGGIVVVTCSAAPFAGRSAFASTLPSARTSRPRSTSAGVSTVTSIGRGASLGASAKQSTSPGVHVA